MDRKSRTSRSANLDEANEEINLWKQICNALTKLETIQKDTAFVVTNINNIHTAVNFEKGVPTLIGNRLMEFYKGGIDLSNDEAKIIHDIIEKVSVLVALRDASEYNNVIDPKRKKRRIEANDEISSLAITISPAAAISGTNTVSSQQVSKKLKLMNNSNSPHHYKILPRGTSVAAKQKDKSEEWILAVVIGYHVDKNKYQVEDVDQDEFGQKQRYMLQPRNIIPIPNVDEVKGLVELYPGSYVLALYPGTTCFYKARVIAPPTKVNKDNGYAGNYKVQFDDDNNEYKYVMPEHVLQIPKPSNK